MKRTSKLSTILTSGGPWPSEGRSICHWSPNLPKASRNARFHAVFKHVLPINGRRNVPAFSVHLIAHDSCLLHQTCRQPILKIRHPKFYELRREFPAHLPLSSPHYPLSCTMAGGPGGSGGGLSGANKVYTFIICAFAAFGGILFGYDTGTIGGTIVMTDWLETFGSYDSSVGFYLPPPHKSLVVSILSAGTFVGALLSFPLGDLLGRKGGLIASCVIFSLGVGMQLDTHWAVFVIGRVVAGLGGKYPFYYKKRAQF